MIILLKIKDANKNAFVLIGWKWIYGFSELETESDIDNDCKWHGTFCPAQCHIFSKKSQMGLSGALLTLFAYCQGS